MSMLQGTILKLLPKEKEYDTHPFYFSPIYAKFFKRIKERGVLSKAVVDVLIEAHDEGNDLNYQDLMTKLEKIKVDDDIDALTSEMLINNSQFVLSQVSSYEEAGDEDEERYMMKSQCIRELLDLAGVESKKSKTKGHVRLNRQGTKKKSKTTQSLATTTPLIRGVFNDYFGAQIDSNENGMKPKTIRKWKCRQCENCLKDDCGKCRNCLDMIKFGGTGKSKQGCIERICNEMVEKNVDNEVSDDDEYEVSLGSPLSAQNNNNGGTIRTAGWIHHTTSSNKNPNHTPSTSFISSKKTKSKRRPRYFVLRENTISYYSRPHHVKAKGTFVLTSGCTVGPVVFASLDEPLSTDDDQHQQQTQPRHERRETKRREIQGTAHAGLQKVQPYFLRK